MGYPRLLVIRQEFPKRRIEDIAGRIRQTMSEARMGEGLRPGSSIAIGVGSRGIANLQLIVRTAVEWWKAQGMAPFVFPAMGSHGAATAKGQAAVLAKLCVTEAGVGCPIRSSLKVNELGETPEGIPVVMDATAKAADGVMLCGRVKWHTDFAGELESGLFKMMAIGLGKFAGAKVYHGWAHRTGHEAVIRSVGRTVLKTGKILGGLAILEDADHQTAHLEAVRVEGMEKREEELLRLVKQWKPRIPVQELDVLIVDEIGKTISGSGMDPKIVNRDIHGRYNPWPDAPLVGRILLRGLNKDSYGNAVGLGMADVVHRRLVRQMKKRPTYVNGITSGAMASIRTPAAFASDRECLEALWPTTGQLRAEDLRIGWIRNSQDLSVMAFSETLGAELDANMNVEMVAGPNELQFNELGDFVEVLR